MAGYEPPQQADALAQAIEGRKQFEKLAEQFIDATLYRLGEVVEAGCKTVIGRRMKCPGMSWSEAGGKGMLDLRCAFLSNRTPSAMLKLSAMPPKMIRSR